MTSLRRLFLVALALRLGLALLTEFKPLFPSYYYTDANLADETAVRIAKGWHEGNSPDLAVSREQRAYAMLLATVYFAFGHHHMLAKALDAAAGAAGIAAFVAAAAPAFGAGAAAAAGWLCVLWPSHVFFTSQSFKESLVLLFTWLALGWAVNPAAAPRRLLGALAGAAGLALLRPFLLAAAALGLAAGGVARLKGRSRAAVVVATAAAALVVFRPLAAFSMRKLITPGDARYSAVVPGTAAGLGEIRRLRQESDRFFATWQHQREIGTQLYYGQRFGSWLDVALFVPKASFAVLFMPLPGLYPMDGKLGRWLAGGENVVLLLLALAAVAAAARRRSQPAAVVLLVFFATLTAGSALFEFDLGGAARHKIIYLPALFPFACAWLGERRQTRRNRLKVFEVLECGGPGGTGNQVAALCNGLDSERFDVGLVYAVRPGSSAEDYRAKAAGAKAAFFVPEMTREIAPLSDAIASLKLYRLFRDERPDVVHAHSSKAGVLARWAAWLAGVPRVFYTPHGYGFLQQDRGPLRRALYKAAEAASSWIGTVVAVSPSEAELARPLAWGKPVQTVCDAYLGELPGTLAPEHHDGVLVGSCGRLTHARNPDAFINLAQRLTDSRNGLKCVWIGGGEQEDAVRRHVENMNMPDRLEVTGWLDAAAAQQRLRGLDVLVHYSRWDGLPNAVLEAMAHGLPVVAADVPGARDAVVHGETGFIAKTEIELLEHTLKLVDDPELRRRLGAAGRKRVESLFRHEEALRRLEALYAGG